MSVVTGPLVLAAPVALAAGAVSFLSPCVLPLVPGYLSYVTGMSGAEVGESTARRWLRSKTFLGAVLFVLGFSAVFVSLGAAFGHFGQDLVLHRRVLQQVFGGLTVVFGIAFSGVLGRIPLLNREARVHHLPPVGLVGAPLLGMLFGFGWTPCIGPTLSSVLLLSSSSATAGRGALLTLVYCLGLGVPFLVVAVAFKQAMGVLAVIRRHNQVVMIIGGLLLVFVGVAEVTGYYQHLVNQLQSHTTGFTPGL
jgi:cytochrome c-type biogenesis protein